MLAYSVGYLVLRPQTKSYTFPRLTKMTNSLHFIILYSSRDGPMHRFPNFTPF
jgi:hypothetical protein